MCNQSSRYVVIHTSNITIRAWCPLSFHMPYPTIRTVLVGDRLAAVEQYYRTCIYLYSMRYTDIHAMNEMNKYIFLSEPISLDRQLPNLLH
jgi:hypothetical protein